MNTANVDQLHWSTWREIPRRCLNRRTVVQSIALAAVVGTILFLINQADVVLSGHATWWTWAKVGLTYIVPFVVANYGILVGSYRPAGEGDSRRGSPPGS